ncbi:uncharacterized protein LOC125236695 isoform X2 [Leguminivora glycinivorella]|uniref:uncharacterized protein LOC125236695 isoform X2 n=1 Tax=Leguminivora glycinivorella TaxID=1035111 RepID=UPI00200FF4A5|nr:uncharacterized protein LOC125236695 isoform X2 [Leguminivora glycinivorella]
MTDKEITMEDLEETAQQTEEQLDLLAWKMDGEKDLAVPVSSQDMCVMTLLKSVSEPVAYTLTEGQENTSVLSLLRLGISVTIIKY